MACVASDRSSHVAVASNGTVSNRAETEEENKMERQAAEAESFAQKRKLSKQDSEGNSVSWAGGSLKKVKEFTLKLKNARASAAAHYTPEAPGTQMPNQGGETNQSRRRKLESIEKSSMAFIARSE